VTAAAGSGGARSTLDLTIAQSSRRDQDLIEVTGVLDYASLPYLRHVVFELLDAQRLHITIDVSGLRILDAASINVLLYLRERFRQLGGDLQLTDATGAVLTALEITGVAKQLGAYTACDWPLTQRQRLIVDLDSLRLSHGQWPAGATELLTELHAMEPDDPARRRARDEIIEMCLPTAHRLARRYGSVGELAADLAQVAALGLIKAVDGFDPARGFEFPTYATPTVLGEIKRHFRDRTSGIRMPRRLQELRISVNNARDELTQKLGRTPTVADLAAHLDVSEEQIIEMFAACHGHRPLSLDLPAAGADDDTALVDVVGDDDPEFGLVEHRQSLRVLMARLPERERQILNLRFYGNLSQSQIAEQVGLSQMHVSRLLRHSLEFLRRRLSD
jgi:RNA polymerase sigma-70 factor (sigma-B/F/G subfamily)